MLSIEQKNNTRAKQSQLKELECLMNIHKNKTLYTVSEIYEIPLEKVDGRKNKSGGGNAKDYPQYKVNRKYDKNKGVYSITLFNDIYIGSTTYGFRPRFQQHISKDNKLPTLNMLKNNATYQILWIANDESEQQIRTIENEYIDYYKNQDDWNIVNSRDAWSYTVPKQKYKTIKIIVKEEDYENTINFMKQNNIELKI